MDLGQSLLKGGCGEPQDCLPSGWEMLQFGAFQLLSARNEKQLHRSGRDGTQQQALVLPHCQGDANQDMLWREGQQSKERQAREEQMQKSTELRHG